MPDASTSRADLADWLLSFHEQCFDPSVRPAHRRARALALLRESLGASHVFSAITDINTPSANRLRYHGVKGLGDLSADQLQHVQRWLEDEQVRSPIDEAYRSASKRKSLVSYRREDVVPDSDWFESRHYKEFVKAAGWGPVAKSFCELPDDRHVHVLTVVRRPDGSAFSKQDLTRLSLAQQVVARLAEADTPLVLDLDAAWSAEGLSNIDGCDRLSPAERRILSHLLNDRAEDEVAGILHRSVHTIHSHAKRIYSKLAVRSRAQLVRLVAERTSLYHRKIMRLEKERERLHPDAANSYVVQLGRASLDSESAGSSNGAAKAARAMN